MMRRILLTAILFIEFLTFCPVCQAKEKTFRIGMIGLDTSHVIAFTKIINDAKNNYGCKVVAGYPGGSADMPASADRVEKFTNQLISAIQYRRTPEFRQRYRNVDIL